MDTPKWIVTSVEPLKDYTLILTFADNSKRVYDARPLLTKSVFSKLNNLSFFLAAHTECGTVVWNDDIDIAPEHLYECSVPLGGEFNV